MRTRNDKFLVSNRGLGSSLSSRVSTEHRDFDFDFTWTPEFTLSQDNNITQTSEPKIQTSQNEETLPKVPTTVPDWVIKANTMCRYDQKCNFQGECKFMHTKDMSAADKKAIIEQSAIVDARLYVHNLPPCASKDDQIRVANQLRTLAKRFGIVSRCFHRMSAWGPRGKTYAYLHFIRAEPAYKFLDFINKDDKQEIEGYEVKAEWKGIEDYPRSTPILTSNSLDDDGFKVISRAHRRKTVKTQEYDEKISAPQAKQICEPVSEDEDIILEVNSEPPLTYEPETYDDDVILETNSEQIILQSKSEYPSQSNEANMQKIGGKQKMTSAMLKEQDQIIADQEMAGQLQSQIEADEFERKKQQTASLATQVVLDKQMAVRLQMEDQVSSPITDFPRLVNDADNTSKAFIPLQKQEWSRLFQTSPNSIMANEELRIDCDGIKYTKQEFFDYYGNFTKWNQALRIFPQTSFKQNDELLQLRKEESVSKLMDKKDQEDEEDFCDDEIDDLTWAQMWGNGNGMVAVVSRANHRDREGGRLL